MATTAAQIAVELIGRNAKLKATLTESSRKGDDFATKMANAGGRAAAGIGAVGAAAITAAVGLNRINEAIARQAIELSGQMAAANASAVELQALSYAAREYGLEQSKVGDILKDTQDKLGDFAANEGGEMKDFFENVGNAAGLTVDKLQELSGPDALIAIKTAMDDANVSASEQINYLESIADEAARLGPLLANNGAEFNRLRQEFIATNSVMTDSEITKYKDYARDVDNLNASFGALVREATGPFVYDLQEAAVYFNKIFGEQRKAHAAKNFNDAHQELVQLKQQLVSLERSKPMEMFNGKAFTGPMTRAWQNNIDETREKIEKLYQRMEQMQKHNDQLNGKKVEPPADLAPKATGGSGGGLSKDELESLQKSSAARLDAMDLQFAQENERFKIQHQQRLKDIAELQVSEQELEARGFESIEALREAYRQQSKVAMDAEVSEANTRKEDEIARMETRLQEQMQRDTDRRQAELDKVRQQLIDKSVIEDEAYINRQAILDQRHQEGLLKEQSYQDLSTKNWEKYQDNLTKLETQKRVEQLRNGAQLFDGLAGMAKAFGGKQNGIYKAMFAASKAFAVAESIVKIQQGIANAASMPFPTNIPAMAAVASQTASIISTIQSTQFKGQAHDGIESVHSSGSWNLEKGERVYTNRSARRLDEMYGRVMNAQPVSAQPAAAAQRPMTLNVINNGEPLKTGGLEQIDDETWQIIFDRVDEDQARRAESGSGSHVQILENMGVNRAAGTYK